MERSPCFYALREQQSAAAGDASLTSSWNFRSALTRRVRQHLNECFSIVHNYQVSPRTGARCPICRNPSAQELPKLIFCDLVLVMVTF